MYIIIMLPPTADVIGGMERSSITCRSLAMMGKATSTPTTSFVSTSSPTLSLCRALQDMIARSTLHAASADLDLDPDPRYTSATSVRAPSDRRCSPNLCPYPQIIPDYRFPGVMRAHYPSYGV